VVRMVGRGRAAVFRSLGSVAAIASLWLPRGRIISDPRSPEPRPAQQRQQQCPKTESALGELVVLP
jgi:hypothetical protein